MATEDGLMGTDSKTKTAPETTSVPDAMLNPDTGKLDLHWPVLVIEGMRTGDGRFIPEGSLGARGLPLPVAGQVKTDEGHKGAEVFGKITRLERKAGPDVVSKETGKPFPEGTAIWEAWGEGDPDTEPGRLAAKGYLTGNSADLAEAEVEEELSDTDGKPTVNLVGGKIAGTTLVPVPAFADGYVEVNGEVLQRDPAVEPLVASGETAPTWTVSDVPVTASGEQEPQEAPFRPPLSAFAKRDLRAVTPLTLETLADGTLAVYGHVADFNRPHISFNGQRVLAPRNPGGYTKAFNTGAVRTLDDDGTERVAAVGRLTYGGGHAPLTRGMTAEQAKAVYDDASTAWAWVTAVDDQFGIQVNGVVIPGVDDTVVTKALAHPVSGDWRVIDGRQELVAAHCVNTPGIPVPRQLVASGQVMALVAAGAVSPAADNPMVLVAAAAKEAALSVVDELRKLLGERGLPAEPEEVELSERHAQALREISAAEVLADLGVEMRKEPVPLSDGVTDPDMVAWLAELERDESLTPDLAYMLSSGPGEGLADQLTAEQARAGSLANWVEQAGGLPPYIKRVVKHLREKGMDQSRAIATAVNVAKKMCATGDTNWPGKQQVNPGSQAEACAAVTRWEAMKAKGKG
jgi:hypothetical protein